jgi:hypothetical protein
MKKIALIAVLAISIASCKKDRTCTCTDTYTTSSGSTQVDTYEVTVKKVTKAQAKDGSCAGGSYQQTAPTTGGKYEFKCELK